LSSWEGGKRREGRRARKGRRGGLRERRGGVWGSVGEVKGRERKRRRRMRLITVWYLFYHLNREMPKINVTEHTKSTRNGIEKSLKYFIFVYTFYIHFFGRLIQRISTEPCCPCPAVHIIFMEENK
jgi:hypothetical protein